jgi:hypothetical protein
MGLVWTRLDWLGLVWTGWDGWELVCGVTSGPAGPPGKQEPN